MRSEVSNFIVDFGIGHVYIQLNNLFNGENKLLADTVNKFLNDHSQEVIKEVIKEATKGVIKEATKYFYSRDQGLFEIEHLGRHRGYE